MEKHIKAGNLPTAEELFDSYFKSKTMAGAQLGSVKSAMIEFAKLHCEAQAKEIVDKAEIDSFCESGDNHCMIIKDSILNAYPLTNIK